MPPKKKDICSKPEPQPLPEEKEPVRPRRSSRRDPEPEEKKKSKSLPKQSEPEPKSSKRTKESQANPQKKKEDDKQPEEENKKESKGDKKLQKQPEKKVEQQQKQTELKKVIMKGNAPVDQFFSKATLYKVHADGDAIYSATLNQSNLDFNNNKFYIIQLLVNEQNKNDIIFFTRWGRVGVTGQKSEEHMRSIEAGIKEYNKKLNQKKKKNYRVVEMNYEENAKEEQPEKKEEKPKDEPASTLDPSVQELIRMIFDMKMMNIQMKEIGYDAKKMPLGKLAKSSIKKGYQILKSLLEEIKGKHVKDTINGLSGDFYSQIPHDFGFKNMANFALDTAEKIKGKLQMLQSLEDIQVFTKLIDEGAVRSDINELDSNYLKLNTRIKPLDKNSETYKLLLKYVENTHATTHTAFHLTVMDIFELQKDVQINRYRKDIHNKQLLWHGSRLTNFVGILSQGLRIAPPQAPVTGYMFGKGVYFADMVSKSANYCFTSRQNNIGLMMLCEVALGNTNEKFYADYYANLLPENKNSTKGCGKTAPKSGEMLGDVLVPCGQGIATGLTASSLLYNEFIVYDVAQIKCRYLFKMKFNYK